MEPIVGSGNYRYRVREDWRAARPFVEWVQRAAG